MPPKKGGKGKAKAQEPVQSHGQSHPTPSDHPPPPKKGGKGKGKPQEPVQSHPMPSDQPPPPKEGGKGKGRGKARDSGKGESSQQAQPMVTREAFPPLQATPPPVVKHPLGKAPQAVGSSQPSGPSQSAVPAAEPSAVVPSVKDTKEGIASLRIDEASTPQQVPVTLTAPSAEFSVPFIRPSSQLAVSKFSQSAIARPGFGKLGNPVTLRANHFLVKIGGSLDQLTIYHYDVSVSPSLTNKGVLRSLIRQLISDNQSALGGSANSLVFPVYDGSKNLYTANQLPFTQKDFHVVLPDKEGHQAPSAGKKGAAEPSERKSRDFRIVIKHAQTYNAGELERYLRGKQLIVPQEIVQSLDIALQQRPMQLYTPVGRSFFTSDLGETPLGNDIVGWRGFYQSLRPTQQGLSLNLDVSSTAFHSEVPVVNYMENVLNKKIDARTRLSDSERVKVKKALTGLKVTVTHRNTNRKFRIGGLTREATSALHFPDEKEGREVTVVEYFRKAYNYAIRYQSLPCLVIGQRSYFPPEVCVIVKGQRYMGKLNEMQVTALLRATCKKPRERQDDIQKMVFRNNYAQDSYAKNFGIIVSAEMAQVRGRVLPPPNLTYANSMTVKPTGGAWNLMGGHRFVEGKTIHNWAIINFSRVPPPVLQEFVAHLSKRCNELGISMNPSPMVPPMSGRLDSVEDSLKKICTAARQKIPQPQWLQLLVVVLAEKTVFYNDIKRICDTQLNVPTQCCLQKHVFKNQSQYLANLAMKINVKVGGRNVLLYEESIKRLPFVSDRPTMLIGADVSHPSPGDETAPSIAAIVGSMDWPQANRYSCLLETQRHRQEIIEGLHREIRGPRGEISATGMIRKLLSLFHRNTGQKPERIIVFRDGVSEGQFYQVLGLELTAIKRACIMMDSTGKYCPKITFVIVQKRHHTRLFPTDRNTDRSGNVQPGTCVDTTICHPREFDFYLNSHSGIQGTSRPTHYHVLFDENNFTADGMQNLCNSLCYTYVRCTRSVSLVPPAYYADLAATRASLYIHSSGSVSGSEAGSQPGTGGTSSTGSSGVFARVSPLPEVNEVPMRGMFFC